MKTLSEIETPQLTKDERSLLLYFETCAVDNSGRVEMIRLNDTDREIAKRWHASGFVRFGRIRAAFVTPRSSHYTHLSEEAWALVHTLRKERAERGWSNRNFETVHDRLTPADAGLPEAR